MSKFELLSFVTVWVLSHFKFLSFATIWVLSQFEVCHHLSFVKFSVVEFCHNFKFCNNLSFGILSQFEFWSFIAICFLEFHHNWSFCKTEGKTEQITETNGQCGKLWPYQPFSMTYLQKKRVWIYFKSRIWETKNLSTNVDSSTDTKKSC